MTAPTKTFGQIAFETSFDFAASADVWQNQGVFYIAGPISDNDPAQVARNKQAFIDAAKALRDRGLTVVSPVELCPEDGKPWAWYMRRCIRAMMSCDEVVLLPGAFHSRGARVEWGLANNLGMRCRALSVVLAQVAR